MPILISSTPLVALNGVVLDTETTGPDPKNARVLQIGAVKIRKGKILSETETAHFSQLVNPGTPIPPENSAIHGIHDADIADAPYFTSAWDKFLEFAGQGLMIGYHIGFDLAVLKSELKAAGQSWEKPRVLDVRLLAKAVQPMLADHNLDTVCNWLKIEIKDRHTALGDAIATAEVFFKLLPALRNMDIRTLAEAEEACRRLSSEMAEHESIGWVKPVRSTPDANSLPQALARIDSYPYRHRIHDVMSSPPIFIKSDTGIQETLDLMVEKKISSVFVSTDNDQHGIVTERDILRAFAGDCAKVKQMPVREIMSFPLQQIPKDAFIYRAIGRMERLGIRHLGVHDTSGITVGAISARDMLHQRASEAIALGDEIFSSKTSAELGLVWAKMPAAARGLLQEDVSVRDITAVVSREICAITRRAAELAEEIMLKDGHGEPPVRYAVMVLGSGGRGESMLAADQDNAIVFEHGEPDGPEDKWFAILGEHIARILDNSGIVYCKGGVMAKNSAWRHSVSGWKLEIDDWIRRSDPKDILNIDIFFDAVAVHGSHELAEELWLHAYERGHQSPGFIKLMADVTREWSAPITIFGGFKTTEGRIDLKSGGLLPILTAARILSIRHNIKARATAERLHGLHSADIGSEEDLSSIISAHKTLLSHALEQQLIDSEVGIPPGYKLDITRLDKPAKKHLYDALKQVEVIQSIVHGPMDELMY
jgi:DNA polymerase-3 subunit epsilon/CBS domain-containing protein